MFPRAFTVGVLEGRVKLPVSETTSLLDVKVVGLIPTLFVCRWAHIFAQAFLYHYSRLRGRGWSPYKSNVFIVYNIDLTQLKLKL